MSPSWPLPIAALSNIALRPDTLDLQEKASPTAQDHSRQPAHPAPLGIGPAAPHQAAAVKHVDDERAAEDTNLQKAWNESGAALRDDPGSDDETTLVSNGERHLQDEQAVRMNGGMSSVADDRDMAEDDMDDMDDDMMDKISSSPSIDDGGLPLPILWPARSSSLTPVSTPTPARHSKLEISSPNINFSSSPYQATPIHLPLAVSAGHTDLDTGTGVGFRMATSHSPSPRSFSLSLKSRLRQAHSPSHHHRGREYTPPKDPGTRGANNKTKRIDAPPKNPGNQGVNNKSRSIATGLKKLSKALPQFRPQFPFVPDPQLQDTHQEFNSLLLQFDSDDFQEILLPTDDPLRDNIFDLDDSPQPFRINNRTLPPKKLAIINTPILKPLPSPAESESSWTTDSDIDSACDMDYNGDDDDSDISFPEESRFIDSGWGGECLREIEDIDFEFVYALHTFVATVEGQANATKGDTMVLLDDSNSYWWLVRVVKDSSIGLWLIIPSSFSSTNKS
jgi:hypothetical protein